jgi:hypothetical protein
LLSQEEKIKEDKSQEKPQKKPQVHLEPVQPPLFYTNSTDSTASLNSDEKPPKKYKTISTQEEMASLVKSPP